MAARLIRLPRTATRPRAPQWGRLLEKVEPHATSALDFHGKILAPGQIVEEPDLWPTEHYPPVPVFLESCQIHFEGRGHHRNPLEHVLWIYSYRLKGWRQVASCSAHTPEEWIPAILPVALRYVHPKVKPPEPDIHQAARRIATVIESEMLTLLTNEQRSLMLQTACDYLSMRRADLLFTRKVYQMPLRPQSEDGFDGLLQAAVPDDVGRQVIPYRLPTY